MMKKTLLSIMTIAVLVSSATAAADSITKDIIVNAEIPSILSVTGVNGVDIAPVVLEQDAIANDGSYKGSRTLVLGSNDGDKLNVNLTEVFTLKSGDKVFKNISVKLSDMDLSTAVVQTDTGNAELVITGNTPDDAAGGEKYTGTLKINFETIT